MAAVGGGSVTGVPEQKKGRHFARVAGNLWDERDEEQVDNLLDVMSTQGLF